MIDMIKLKSKCNYFDFENMVNRVLFHGDIDNVLTSDRCKYWCSFRAKTYRHNYSFKDEKGHGYFVAIGHNMERAVLKQDYSHLSIVLEFNPNKVFIGSFESELLKYFKYQRAEVVSIDWAVDYDGLKSSDIIIDSERKRHMTKMTFPNTQPTYYFGKSYGRVKIYDKARELDLPLPNERTRFEISLKVDLTMSALGNYIAPSSGITVLSRGAIVNGQLSLDNQLFLNSLKPSIQAVVLALENNLIDIKIFDRKSQLKYLDIMKQRQLYEIDFRMDDIKDALLSFRLTYLGL